MPELTPGENQDRINYLNSNPITEAEPDDEDFGNTHATVRLVTKEEQQKRKEDEVKDVDRAFTEYIKTKAVLVAKQTLFAKLNLGEISNPIRNNYLQKSVAREVMFNPGKKGAHIQKLNNDEFLICIIDENGDMLKLNLKISEIPGANIAIAEDARFSKHPISFITEEFKIAGFDYQHIGSYNYLTNDTNIKLETLFSDVENTRQ